MYLIKEKKYVGNVVKKLNGQLELDSYVKRARSSEELEFYKMSSVVRALPDVKGEHEYMYIYPEFHSDEDAIGRVTSYNILDDERRIEYEVEIYANHVDLIQDDSFLAMSLCESDDPDELEFDGFYLSSRTKHKEVIEHYAYSMRVVNIERIRRQNFHGSDKYIDNLLKEMVAEGTLLERYPTFFIHPNPVNSSVAADTYDISLINLISIEDTVLADIKTLNTIKEHDLDYSIVCVRRDYPTLGGLSTLITISKNNAIKIRVSSKKGSEYCFDRILEDLQTMVSEINRRIKKYHSDFNENTNKLKASGLMSVLKKDRM